MIQPHARTLPDLLDELAAEVDERPAVIHAEGRTTYADLRARARQVADALHRAGVTDVDKVGLLATNRIEWLETYFGIAISGATTHAFNTWVTTEELAYLLDDSGCSVLVLLARHGRTDHLGDLRALVPEVWEASPGQWRSSRFPLLRTVIVIAGSPPPGAHAYEDWLAESSGESAAPQYETNRSRRGQDATSPDRTMRDETAVVLYTSGSTARPKAVPLEHRGMCENGFNIGERMGLTGEDRVWLGSPLFWSYGCANAVMATFTHRATLVLQEHYTPQSALDLIEAEQCTAAYLLPTFVRSLTADPAFDRKRASSLRTGLTIGTPDDLRLAAHELGVEDICNVYGATEVYGNCCVTPHDLPLEDRLTCQGPPLPGVELRIVEPAGTTSLPVGTRGEIQVRGYVTPGYLGVDMLAAGLMTPDGFYSTGDVGHLDDRGYLHYSARSSEMIKTSGINVAPAEVEDFLSRLDDVAEVAVVGAPDPHKDEVVVAYVVARPGAHLVAEDLIAQCRGRLASYKVPTWIVVADALPKTDTGKLQRNALRAMAGQLTQGAGCS